MTKKKVDEEQIFLMRLAGQQCRAIAKELGIAVEKVEAIIEERMIQLTPEYRLQAMALDLERMEAIMARHLRDAIAGNISAGHLCLKIAERRAAMLGTDAPVRIDAVQLVHHVVPRESTTDQIERVLEELKALPKPDEPKKH
jgi:hypothetical protein